MESRSMGVSDNLKKDLIDARDELEAYKKVCEDFEVQMKYKENQNNIAIKQKDDILKFTQARVTELSEENARLTNRNASLENQLRQAQEEQESWAGEKKNLKEKVALLLQESNTNQV